MEKSITKDIFESFSKKNLGNKLVMNSVIKNGIDSVAIDNNTLIKNQPVFSLEIDTGKVTNQKKSGRCWMFAGLNTLRQKVIEKYNIKEFELSQCYTMFWDKFEKANYFLESIIDTIDEPNDSRLVMWLLDSPVQDGGQWDMFCNIVEKYGVVPKYVMPETFQSSQSGKMNSLLSTKLRQGALKIRKLHKEGMKTDKVRAEKESILSDIYGMLCCFLGEPPRKFNFEYRDGSNEFFRSENISPLEFYKSYIGVNIRDYVSIINAPQQSKKFDTSYTISYLGNVIGGKDIKYLNVDIDTFRNLALMQLKDHEPVWFGCDVGKMSDSSSGVMDTELYSYDEVLKTDFAMSKGERLDYCESCLTHAMVLTGVNIVDGKPERFKVQNSWGEEKGQKGYFIMDTKWFDEYTYQIVINKKYLSDKLKDAYEKKPVVLMPWDPMGSLA